MMPIAMWTEAKLGRSATVIFQKLKVRDAVLDIFLLPHREMAALKKKFFRPGEPNVISFPEPVHFPHPEVPRGKRYLGEIYLNRDILKRSPERAKPLLLHGILHLLGYDHIKNKDAEMMEKLEKKILGRL